MRFDPRTGFDRDAMTAITEPLPRADANLIVLRDVANALRDHLSNSKPKPTNRNANGGSRNANG